MAFSIDCPKSATSSARYATSRAGQSLARSAAVDEMHPIGIELPVVGYHANTLTLLPLTSQAGLRPQRSERLLVLDEGVENHPHELGFRPFAGDGADAGAGLLGDLLPHGGGEYISGQPIATDHQQDTAAGEGIERMEQAARFSSGAPPLTPTSS
jgi:hypothetical protein